MLIWRATLPGSAIGEEGEPCPRCKQPIEIGQGITPCADYHWRHSDCAAPVYQPPAWYWSASDEYHYELRQEHAL
jgi:hypothetical protein